MVDEKQPDRGLLPVFTGSGKGKATAALSLAFRAIDHNFSVCMTQFFKVSWKYGKFETARHFDNLTEVHVMGGIWKSDDLGKDFQAAG